MAFGLPNIPGFSGEAIRIGTLGQLESLVWNWLTGSLTWGIYTAGTGSEAIQVDSVISASKTASSVVSNYPVTQGSFSSYNKVDRPTEYNLTLYKSGRPDERKKFVDWLIANKSAATLFDIVTPEDTYRNVTLQNFSISRSVRDGTVTSLAVDCTFQEIRQAPVVFYNLEEGKANTENAQNPEDKPTAEGKYTSPIEYVVTSIQQGVEFVEEAVDDLQNLVTEAIRDLTDGLMGISNSEIGRLYTESALETDKSSK